MPIAPLCAHVCLCAKVVPVWHRDNPHTGTLHTAVRMHSPNPQPLASTNISSWNKCTHTPKYTKLL